jgi:hypothetical protein
MNLRQGRGARVNRAGGGHLVAGRPARQTAPGETKSRAPTTFGCVRPGGRRWPEQLSAPASTNKTTQTINTCC